MIRPSRFPSSSHSKDGCEMRTNPLSVSPPSPRPPRRVIVARVQLLSFLVPLRRSSSLQVICQTVRVFSFLPHSTASRLSDAVSGQICRPVSPLPMLPPELPPFSSVASNILNEQCNGEFVEANQITQRPNQDRSDS